MPWRVDPADGLEDGLHQQRREAERRLVEQEQPRLRHQPPGDGEHLLLAAGERAGELANALAQPGKEGEAAVEVLLRGLRAWT